jgi:hypothetical protein
MPKLLILKDLLNLNESKWRRTYIGNLLGGLESEVLNRKDLGILDIVRSFLLLGLLAA